MFACDLWSSLRGRREVGFMDGEINVVAQEEGAYGGNRYRES